MFSRPGTMAGKRTSPGIQKDLVSRELAFAYRDDEPAVFIEPGKTAQPWITSTPLVRFNHAVSPRRAVSTRSRIRAIAAGKSTVATAPVETLKSAARRTICATRADLRNVLVGVQPLLTHVPPSLSPSIRATDCPRLANPTASEGAALARTDDYGVKMIHVFVLCHSHASLFSP